MTPGEERWQALCAEARALGLEEIELGRLVCGPLSALDAQWLHWQPHKTTEALARWVRGQLPRLVAMMAANTPAPAGPPPTSFSGGGGWEPPQGSESAGAGTFSERGQHMAGFVKATKKQARLRLALVGPPGSGKTYTALAVATALGGRVALIDTERGSASKYAWDGEGPPPPGLFRFDTKEINDDFHPKHYIAAIKEAESLGYDCLIVDSLSHAWIGPGGGLDLHDQAVDRQREGKKNPYVAWKEVTPHHNALVQAVIACRCHVIATMRSKVEYAQENGKVSKLGMAPLMRDGVEYEFDVVGDLDLQNTLVISKTRCSALRGAVIREPGVPLAATLARWLSDGVPAAPAPATPAAPRTTRTAKLPATASELLTRLEDKDLRLEQAGLIEAGRLLDDVRAALRENHLAEDVATLDPRHFAEVVAIVTKLEAGYKARATPQLPQEVPS